MDNLFEIPESKSPKLKWMERNHITIKTAINVDDGDTIYQAFHGMQRIAERSTEDSVIRAAAKSLNVKLWNEE